MKKSPTYFLTAFVFSLLTLLCINRIMQASAYAQQSPPPTAIPIYEIQGAGLESPYFGQWVDSFGIVTGITSNGYYLQDPAGDGNAETSDGIYVYTQRRPKVSVGDCLALQRAFVDEYYEKTELSRTKAPQQVDWCGGVSPQPVPIGSARSAADPANRFERFEGMLVVVDDLTGVVQGPTKRFRNGDAEIAFVPQSVVPYLPAGRVFQHEAHDMAALMFVSNALGGQLPELNWGDTIQLGAEPGSADAVVGLFDYNFGKYQFLPRSDQDVGGESIVPGPDQLEPPLPVDEVAGEFTVCTFNLLGLGQGSAQYPDQETYDQQLAKRALAIAERLQGCTIIGLQEAGTAEDAENLARLLDEEHGLAYTATAIEGPGTDSREFPLTNALLTRTDRVDVIDAQIRQGCSKLNYDVKYEPGVCERGTYGLFNRPPLVVELSIAAGSSGQTNAEPYRLTVIGNHWKSKGGDETVNVVRRQAQADHVAQLVGEQLMGDAASNVVVLGDLNDYYRSGPVEALLSGVEPPMVHSYDFLADLDRYTYIFNGGSQVLDHMIVTGSMSQDISEIRPIRLNADYAYPASIDAESVQHSSDHDPVMMRVRPGQAAWIGGNVGYRDIRISLLDQAGSEQTSAISDDQGEFRIWNVRPGTHTVRFAAPPAIQLIHEELSVDVVPGANWIEDVGPRHRAVDLGLAAALVAPMLIDEEDIE